MKKVLHLNSYYIDNHLYASLYASLDTKFSQVVYIPIKQDREPANEIVLENAEFHFSKILKSYHKYHFWGKIRTLLKNVVGKGLHKDVSFVHAHNLFNDGVVAYELKKRFGLRYIVAIRSTDVGLQYRLMKHRRPYIHRVLANAEKIVFISETFRQRLFTMMPDSHVAKLKSKTTVISNGIDRFWHRNFRAKKELENPKKANFLFVGQIIPRKGLDSVILCIHHLNNSLGYDLTFTVVGDKHHNDLEYFDGFMANVKDKPFVNYLGSIRDKEKLLKIYRQADAFVMISRQELFGLVYIEALSQGLPLLYSDNEGITPFLSNFNVGESVCYDIEDDLQNKMIKFLKNYQSYEVPEDLIQNFDWNIIATTYGKFYSKET